MTTTEDTTQTVTATEPALALPAPGDGPRGPEIRIVGDNGPSGPDGATERAAPIEGELEAAMIDGGSSNDDAALASNWVQTRLGMLAPLVRDRLTRDLSDLLQGARRQERRRLAEIMILSAEERDNGGEPASLLEMLSRQRPPAEAPNRSHWRYLDLAVIEEWQASGRYPDLAPGDVIRTFYEAGDEAPVALKQDGEQLAVWTGGVDVERPQPFT